MGVFQRGHHYYIDYWVEGRRFREKAGRTKREAENALATVKADILRGKFSIRRKVTVTFKDYADRYMIEYSKPNKRSWKRDQASLVQLLPFFGNEPLEKINKFRVEQYQTNRLRGGKKPGTVVREMALLKHLYSRAVEEGLVLTNPVKQVRFVRLDNIVTRFPSQQEIALLLEACTEEFQPILATAIFSGMRKAEVLGLRWENVDLVQRVIRVTQTKSGKDRWIPINDSLMEVLVPLKERATSDYVFTSKKSGTRYIDIDYTWKGVLKRSGVQPYKFHQLRHGFASHLVAAGVDLVTVKELLGHSDIRITMRYAHSAPEYKREAVARLNTLFDANNSHNLDTVNASSVA